MTTQHPTLSALISARILSRMQRDRLNVFQAIDQVLGPGTSDKILEDVFQAAKTKAQAQAPSEPNSETFPMLLINCIVYDGNRPIDRFSINHSDPAERRILGQTCAEAFAKGHSVVTWPHDTGTVPPGLTIAE